VELAIEAVNIVADGVDAAWALHVCYGNRYARPLWEGHYDFLFPAVLAARIDQLVLEFARKGPGDLRLLQQYAWDHQVGLGVIDVKSTDVESPDLVASRIRRALEVVPAERLVINPDCGLRHLPADVARAKLRAMVAGADLVRNEQRSGGPYPGPADRGQSAAETPAADGNGSAAAAGQPGSRSAGKKTGSGR
jgi:5-methyltetrahydropteroyltriglutamate--homocysteine methyltransferase